MNLSVYIITRDSVASGCGDIGSNIATLVVSPFHLALHMADSYAINNVDLMRCNPS